MAGTEVVFETHSTTEDNERGIATGWLPGRLSAAGREQARAMGDRRRADRIAAVFTSDLDRAVETVAIAFADSTVPVLHDWRLRECDYGDRNGMAVAELHQGRPRHLDLPYPGGESWREAVARVGRFLDDLPSRWDGARVLVVGHTATRWAFDHILAGVPLGDLLYAAFDWQPGWEYLLESYPAAGVGGTLDHAPTRSGTPRPCPQFVGDTFHRRGRLWSVSAWPPECYQRAVAYVTDPSGRLLVFDHLGIPEAGTQVPGGGIGASERPEVAVVRELAEESGITDATVIRKLGESWFLAEAGRVPAGFEEQVHHAFHLGVDRPRPSATWEWDEGDGGEVVKWRYTFRWIALDAAGALLHASQAMWLPVLGCSLSRAAGAGG